MDEEILTAEKPVKESKPKELKKKFEVFLVTNTSIIYKDKDVFSLIGKKGYEDVKQGDMIEI